MEPHIVLDEHLLVMMGFHEVHYTWLKHLVHVANGRHVPLNDDVSEVVQGDGAPHYHTI